MLVRCVDVCAFLPQVPLFSPIEAMGEGGDPGAGARGANFLWGTPVEQVLRAEVARLREEVAALRARLQTDISKPKASSAASSFAEGGLGGTTSAALKAGSMFDGEMGGTSAAPKSTLSGMGGTSLAPKAEMLFHDVAERTAPAGANKNTAPATTGLSPGGFIPGGSFPLGGTLASAGGGSSGRIVEGFNAGRTLFPSLDFVPAPWGGGGARTRR